MKRKLHKYRVVITVERVYEPFYAFNQREAARCVKRLQEGRVLKVVAKRSRR